jgi:hypothetical protein
LNSKIIFKELPSKTKVFFKCLYFTNRRKNIYSLVKQKLISNYLNITSLIKIRNELNFLKNFLFQAESDFEACESIIKIIPINDEFNPNQKNEYGQGKNEMNYISPLQLDPGRSILFESYLKHS